MRCKQAKRPRVGERVVHVALQCGRYRLIVCVGAGHGALDAVRSYLVLSAELVRMRT